jgi:hypothetical protein
VPNLEGPDSIKSHLNHVTNFAVGCFASDDVKYINTDFNYYAPQGFILMGSAERFNNDESYWQLQQYLINASIGK